MGITHGDATATMKARKMTEWCQDGDDGWGEWRIGCVRRCHPLNFFFSVSKERKAARRRRQGIRLFGRGRESLDEFRFASLANFFLTNSCLFSVSFVFCSSYLPNDRSCANLLDYTDRANGKNGPFDDGSATAAWPPVSREKKLPIHTAVPRRSVPFVF